VRFFLFLSLSSSLRTDLLLPSNSSFLAPGRSSTSNAGGSPRTLPEPEDLDVDVDLEGEADISIPSFLLDTPTTDEPPSEAEELEKRSSGGATEIPLPSSASASEVESDAFDSPECASQPFASHTAFVTTGEDDQASLLPPSIPLVPSSLRDHSHARSTSLERPLVFSDDDEHTPRVAPPPSPPSPEPSFASPSRRKPQDAPLPPSPPSLPSPSSAPTAVTPPLLIPTSA
jgi:hypothetical protein